MSDMTTAGVRRQDTLGGSDGEDDWQAIDNVSFTIIRIVVN